MASVVRVTDPEQADVRLSLYCYMGCESDAYRALPWRARLAWRIRRLARRIEGNPMTQTYTLDCFAPTELDGDDLDEALHHGMLGAAHYLADLARDRRVK